MLPDTGTSKGGWESCGKCCHNIDASWGDLWSAATVYGIIADTFDWNSDSENKNTLQTEAVAGTISLLETN